MNKNKEIIEELMQQKFECLCNEVLTEEYIKTLSIKLFSTTAKCEKYTISIIEYFIENSVNKAYDWNMGSFLQYVEPYYISEAIRKLDSNKKAFLFDSIGVTWVLGENKTKDTNIINFLKDSIKYSRNPKAWWRAAISLEKLTNENFVNILKRNLKQKRLETLEYYLNNLSNEKSIIGVLIYANNKNIKDIIYSTLKQKLLKEEKDSLNNIIWLLGRLRLIDNQIFYKIIEILDNNNDYEFLYYTFMALCQNPKNIFLPFFMKYMDNEDALLRKMAVRGIGEIGLEKSINILEIMLQKEDNVNVLEELTIALNNIKNFEFKERKLLLNRSLINENGLIGDDSDKWYADPSIYNVFSEAEDVENICFELIVSKLKQDNIKIKNPIDLATGTGRTFRNIADNMIYDGTLYGIDYSSEMIEDRKSVL